MRRTAGSARVSRLSVSCDYAFSKRVSMQFIDYYADVCGSDTNDNNNKKISEEPAYDREVIDDTEIENNPSDYYGLTLLGLLPRLKKMLFHSQTIFVCKLKTY